jgi:hypothetical protein
LTSHATASGEEEGPRSKAVLEGCSIAITARKSHYFIVGFVVLMSYACKFAEKEYGQIS